MSELQPTISWPELVVLMAYGDGRQDRYRGEYRVREVTEIDDEAEDETEPEGAQSIVEHPTLGRVRVDERTFRAYRLGESVRVESTAGQPLFIVGRDKRWIFDRTDTPTEYERATSCFEIGGTGLLDRRPASRWEGEDFTQLTGPIGRTQFLGRTAWTFELAPPPHKPYPVQMIVDADTGLVLREANAGFGSYEQWTDLQLEADLPDELFSWTGPVRRPEEHEIEHEQELARRRAWLAGRGVRQLSLSLELDLVPHEWDELTGRFHASVHTRSPHGCMLRRPHTDQAWQDVDSMDWPFEYRWHDERWDWYLGIDLELTGDQLASLRTQLETTS